MIIHHDQPKRSIGRQVRLAARLVLRESTGGSRSWLIDFVETVYILL